MSLDQLIVRNAVQKTTINGLEFEYTATSAETVLPGADGKPGATMFSFAYTRNGDNVRNRPIIFIWNGGPGSSSIFTHMVGFGPRTAIVPGPERYCVAPLQVAQNPDSLLDVADLVFLDPPGTGFARLLPEGKPEDFFGVVPDAKAFSIFIKDWLVHYGRWASPKFLMGQSYGTIRAPVVARMLMGDVAGGELAAVSLNGIITLGQTMHYSNPMSSRGDTDFVMALPSQAAVAQYHTGGRGIVVSFHEMLARVQEFCTSEYLPALYRGRDLGHDKTQTIARTLEDFTGIPASKWIRSNLKISTAAFCSALLEEHNLIVSPYDGRFVIDRPQHFVDPVGDDPMLAPVAAAGVAALHDELRRCFDWDHNTNYVAIDFKSNARWDWKLPAPGEPAIGTVADIMLACLHRDPRLNLFMASGAYDLVTPWAAAEHVRTRRHIDDGRIEHRVYASGHSPFIGEENRAQISGDIRSFIKRVSP
ncbi:S10 family serine carboxypeptidase-like protein [Burkholderia anthina]|uniref:S10 family serine carboxypeptidase-like protein n=1 Tax=Burkholderia anthina TaxID=179879 RepID=UPI00158E07F8|nr:hypothetical protein [Burkholderia anthina]